MQLIDHKRYDQQYYLKNKERIQQKTKKYRLAHLEQNAEYMKQYQVENRVKLQAYLKEYNIKNNIRLIQHKKDFYQKNSAKCIKQSSQRVTRRRDYLTKIKESSGCVGCGAGNNLVFHHRKPNTKINKVSMLAGYKMSILLKEVAKCDVLCMKCHDALHKKYGKRY